MISLDTETNGINPYHGSKPFFITSANSEGQITYWDVDVDPFTREPQWTEEDLDEVAELLVEADEIILQNAKFDITQLWTLRPEFGREWDWSKTHDTLIAGHLLASNQPHDLTTMALVYLGINIQPLEIKLKEAVNEARRLARSKYPDWAIANADREDMPSVKGGFGGCDYWLPKAIAKQEEYPADHPWWSVLREYSNADSAVTIKLFEVMRKKLQQDDLWEIYLERMKCLPVAFEMEQTGITISGGRLAKQTEEYTLESQEAGKLCSDIAKKRGFDLTLPKSGNNKSLLNFAFGESASTSCPDCTFRKGPRTVKCKTCGGSGELLLKGLRLPKVVETGTGNPSLNKVALDEYLSMFPEDSEEYQFVKALRDKRARDTALTYMESYQRFWIPTGIVNKKGEQLWFRLHPSLNPTGTDTLRWSSSSPNEQNISKREGFNLRYSFGPAPGREWWSLDYQNIELRIPAYESGEEAMIELFERPDDPPYFGSYHLLNASIIYPDLFKPLANKKGEFKKKYTSTWYQWCKNAGFALIYGCGEEKFDSTCKKPGAYASLKRRMPKLFALADKWIAHANKHGYVETLPDKTVNPKRGYPVYCTRSRWGSVSPTIPLNYHTQSTAMWATMKAMIRVREFLSEIPGCHIALQVHDELVIDLPFVKNRGNLPKVRKVAQLMRESGRDIGIPLTVGIEYHPENWSEGVTIAI